MSRHCCIADTVPEMPDIRTRLTLRQYGICVHCPEIIFTALCSDTFFSGAGFLGTAVAAASAGDMRWSTILDSGKCNDRCLTAMQAGMQIEPGRTGQVPQKHQKC